jgi:hypothetical protein
VSVAEYNLLLLLHILLFVYWLGADIGVYYSSRYAANPTLTREARATVVRIMLWIDQIPRACLVLMLAVGYSVGFHMGMVHARPGAIVALWIIALAWLALVIAIHHSQGTPRGERLRKIDMVWRIVLILALSVDAWASFVGEGHLLARWLAVKVQIYALLIFFGLMIRVAIQPFVVAFGRLMREGATPELDAQIATGLARSRPWVIAIWIGLIAAAFIGLQKPPF